MAVYGSPEPVEGDAEALEKTADDVSPFQIQQMAGNGQEFTRSTKGDDLQEHHDFIPLGGVKLRGQKYRCYPVEHLTYELMKKKKRPGELNPRMGGGQQSSSSITFRVVLPIPNKTPGKPN